MDGKRGPCACRSKPTENLVLPAKSARPPLTHFSRVGFLTDRPGKSDKRQAPTTAPSRPLSLRVGVHPQKKPTRESLTHLSAPPLKMTIFLPGGVAQT